MTAIASAQDTLSRRGLRDCPAGGNVTRSYARRGQHRAAVVSRVVGIVFAAAFAGIATGAGRSEINLGFTAAIIASYAWLTAVAAGLYRRTRLGEVASALPAQ